MNTGKKILVVRKKVLFPDGVWKGFKEYKEEDIKNIINENGEYIERSLAERDESYKQIIPQILLSFKNKIFIHKIPVSGSEERLHDMWPIFLGGHVDETDLDIEAATIREFEEEINYKGNISEKKFLGLINLESPLVNKVHIGLIWKFTGDSEEFESSGDKGLIDGKFVDIKELANYYDNMNYWSQVFYSHLAQYI
jgi:predicted NUDIX family phosphoesterase